MKMISQTSEILQSIESIFSNQCKTVRKNVALTAYSIIKCQKVNTAEIARHMGEVNGLDFKANEARMYRLLQSKKFQVDDKMWRCYISLIFKLIKENTKNSKNAFHINVDYTTDADDFLILCASIFFQGQSIPIYFSMRNYPKRSGMHDQKKMEEAFFRALRHILPKGNEYTIVADRGFGHDRIITTLEKLKFKYVLRLNENLNIEVGGKKVNLKDLPHKKRQLASAKVVKWQREISFVKRVKAEKYWLLATNLGPKDLKKVGLIYEERFSIEKMFKNKKSGGFDIEKLQIKKYDRFKRLLFISCISYAIMIFTGIFINNKSHPIKKNFSLTTKVLTVFLPS